MEGKMGEKTEERLVKKEKEKEYLLYIFKILHERGKITKEELNKCNDKVINGNINGNY